MAYDKAAFIAYRLDHAEWCFVKQNSYSLFLGRNVGVLLVLQPGLRVFAG